MDEDCQNEKIVSTPKKPLVFISHDTRDADLAEAFSALLKSASTGVLKSFRTSDKKGTQGIQYGVEWYPEIIKNIQDASDVVCLLTQNSVDRPWILFEAGMAKGKLDTPILGITLGIQLKDAATGPFAQFQNCADDEDSLTKLVSQLVNRIPDAEPDNETIKYQVVKFKETIKPILDSSKTSNKKAESKNESKENSSARLFEEIKMMFQELTAKNQEKSRNDPFERRILRKFHPMMVDELCRFGRSKTTVIMVLLSLYKDSPFPWIYELGIDLMKKSALESNISGRKRLFKEFNDVVTDSLRNPLMRDLFVTSHDDFFWMKEVAGLLLDNMRDLFISKEIME